MIWGMGRLVVPADGRRKGLGSQGKVRATQRRKEPLTTLRPLHDDEMYQVLVILVLARVANDGSLKSPRL